MKQPDDAEPDWWVLIDKKAALKEQFPDAEVLRATERPSLGLLHEKPKPQVLRFVMNQTAQHQDADHFIR